MAKRWLKQEVGFTKYREVKCGGCGEFVPEKYLYVKVGYADKVCQHCFIGDPKV